MSASTVYLRVNRVPAELCSAARALPVADLHDAMPVTSARAHLMSPRMRPLNRGLRIAGPAVTAFCAPGDNLMMHRALYLARPGDVLVVTCAAESSGAQWGDLAARYALKKGLAGVVVHGCIRDTDVLEEMRFPVWATAISAMRPAKAGHGAVNAPLVCDGVLVNPGDLIVADGDGVVCLPRDEAATVVAQAKARIAEEQALAERVAAGDSLWELGHAGNSYGSLGVCEIDAAFDTATDRVTPPLS